MKKAKFLSMLIASLTAMMAFIACGDDNDDEPFDPTKPYMGTWIVEEVRGWNYHGYQGQLIPDEEEEARKFSKKWTGKSIKVSSKTTVEDNKIFLEKTATHKEYLEIGTITENTMTVYYVSLSYWEEDVLSSKETATMELIHK